MRRSRRPAEELRGTVLGLLDPTTSASEAWYVRRIGRVLSAEYFFEIAPNPQLKAQLFTSNKLRQITGKEAAETRDELFECSHPSGSRHKSARPRLTEVSEIR